MFKTQFTLYMENRPGALFAVTCRLAEEKINIEGLSVAGSEDTALAQIITSDDEATHALLKATATPYSTENVAVLAMRNEPGALSRGLARLSKAGVNIDYLYGTCSDCSATDQYNIVISAPDLQAVEDAWGD